jgi:Predicted 3''-5'' exonuclease related to the exonuclease domain of PolB.
MVNLWQSKFIKCMLDNIKPENILFLDIETVPEYIDFKSASDHFRKLWEKKAERLRHTEDETAESLYQRAGIYAEFGKIICISVGILNKNELRIKSFAGHDEKDLLLAFAGLLNSHYAKAEHNLCAHNGKEFDFPYIARRMLINQVKIPKILDISGRKPWEVSFIDTMELWKFGDFKNYTSLELLAAVFNIPSPKDDIAGSEVHNVYWVDDDLPRIVKYCQKDVITIVQLYRCFRGESLLPEQNVSYVE